MHVFREPFRSFFAHFMTIADDEQWVSFYRSLPPARFIVWLANDVSTTLLLSRPYAIDELLIRVNNNTSGMTQTHAEQFLHHRIGSPFRPVSPRITMVFRGIIMHKLRKAWPH